MLCLTGDVNISYNLVNYSMSIVHICSLILIFFFLGVEKLL